MRKALYMLAELNETDIRWLAGQGSHRTVARDEVLIAEGRAVDTLYIVTDGLLEVVIGRAGTQIARLVSGDIVGEMSLIEKSPPSVSVRALEQSRVLAVPHGPIVQRLERDPAFSARFYKAIAVFLSDRLRSTVARLGYGHEEMDARSRFEAENELDEGLLDNIHVAGDRMRRLIALLEGAE